MLPQERREGHQGSSPLARGLREGPRFRGPQARIIPARAGFTHPERPTWPGPGDHPRSRGVYAAAGFISDIESGSSPLARGLRHDVVDRTLRGRIIPARAGFTEAAPQRDCRPRDHPRSRGVYHQRRPELERELGSSPLARGLPRDTQQEDQEARIIPARAGFTGWEFLKRADIQGSSPLARGLHELAEARARDIRIIPARAGFTLLTFLSMLSSLDHPRSRGVYPTSRTSNW